MACSLNKEQVSDLYEVLYGEIIDRINNSTLPDIDINQLISEVYTVVKEASQDQVKALLFAQAIPDVFQLVIQDTEINDYLVDNDFDFTSLAKMRKQFADLTQVVKAVVDKPIKKAKQIKEEIIEAAEDQFNIPLADPEDIPEEKLADVQNRMRIRFPLALTGQFAMILNPEGVTESERNRVDPEKNLIYSVIKDIVNLSLEADADNPLEYQGYEIALTLRNLSDLDLNLLTASDRDYVKTMSSSRAIVAFISDKEGNILYFDNDGNITSKSKGRPVYQGLRAVDKINGKLAFVNSKNKYSTLVEPEIVAKQELNLNDSSYKIITDKALKKKTQEVRLRQENEMNQLYNLSKFMKENPDVNPVISITGGSYGAVNKSFIPLADTPITEEDVAKATVVQVGKNEGKLTFTLSSNKPNITVNEDVYLQRGDIDEALADKIATVLTTKAKLKGRELNLNQRKDYYDAFQSNAIFENRISVKIENRDDEDALVIKLDGEEIPQETLYTTESKELIKKHLLNAKVKMIKRIDSNTGKVTETLERYPANVNYSQKYFSQDFTDYKIEGNTITPVLTSYFDLIKPYIKIEYSTDSMAYFVGVNSYLTFTLPTDIAPYGKPVSEKEAKPKKKKTKESTKRSHNPDAGEISIKGTTLTYQGTLTKNINDSDATLFLALPETESNKLGEHVKEKAEENFISSKLDFNAEIKDKVVSKIVDQLNKFEVTTLNLFGSNLFEVSNTGFTQDEVDEYIYELAEKILKNPDLQIPIEKVILSGQSGVEEAFAKAASELGLDVEVRAFKDYAFILPSKTSKLGYTYVKNQKRFYDRFGLTPSKKVKSVTKTPYKKAGSKKVAYKKAATTFNRKSTKTSKEKVQEVFQGTLSLKDIKTDTKNSFLDRSKNLSGFLDRVFTSKADKDKATDWWNKTFGKTVSLERITEIVNSDAFATFTEKGVVLYEADGGTSVDLYHEAFHVFTQLFLTKDEKIALYDSLAELPKYSKLEFDDSMELYKFIEEDLAEDFRSYMKFKKKFPGIVGRIFEKIGTFLRKLFSAVTRRDLTRPRDIPAVKEIYDKLYRADKDPSILQSLKPSTQNIIFGKLNRSKDVILPNKNLKENNLSFTLEESKKAVDIMDSLLADVVKKKVSKDSPHTYLKSPERRKEIYDEVLVMLEDHKAKLSDQLQKVILENIDTDTPNIALEDRLTKNLDLIIKMVLGYGKVSTSLDKKQLTGVVAYHIENSRFDILKEQYEEDEEDDPTNIQESRVFKDSGGNLVSSKDIASQETLTALSMMYVVEKVDEEGNIIYKKDELGNPVLQNLETTWNNLAKMLEGSFDYEEMYTRIEDNLDNYPYLQQLLDLLPNPGSTYESSTQYDFETAFWQDLKKPRIGYIQLNINEEVEEDRKKYSARLNAVNFDISRVIKDWRGNFITDSLENNEYIEPEGLNNFLNLKKIVQDFSVKGKFNSKKAVQFLDALGIRLDTSSHAINDTVKDNSFVSLYQIDRMFEAVKLVYAASLSDNEKVLAKVNDFRQNPVGFLIDGLPEEIVKGENKQDVSSKIKQLAIIQIQYSDSYSNFSVTNPEGSRVWEHFLDSTVTRIVTSINKANSWQELTSDLADPNGKFKHMRWLSKDNNTFSQFSVLLNQIFYLDIDENTPLYGSKRPDGKLILQNVSGTQLITKKVDESKGTLTASTDATSKFLQELNTMLLNGVEEFMRHASKNTSMGLTADNINTYSGKKNKKLYVDIEAFRPGTLGKGENAAIDIILGYFAGESNRILRFLSNPTKFENYVAYNREVIRKSDGKVVKAGAAFTIFDDMLTEETQKEIYDIIDELVKSKKSATNLYDLFLSNEDLFIRINDDLKAYFQEETKNNLGRLLSNVYVDETIKNIIDDTTLSNRQILEVTSKAYTYNSFIHKFETMILLYGDAVQYNHDKEEFHKRNAGLAAGGRSFRADGKAIKYINSHLKPLYTIKQGHKPFAYDGTFKTAILKEAELRSKYRDEYYKDIYDSLYRRLKDADKAKEIADKVISEYDAMKIGDGQGYITLDSYRKMKKLENKWSDAQERLYKKVVNNENLNPEDIIEFFPPYKVQYFGNIEASGLPVNSFHKFSLMPLIPGFTLKGTILDSLHEKMMEKGLDYVLFQSGSKVNHIGKGDNILNDDGTFNNDVEFTVNTIYAEYLKNQTEVNSAFKNKSIFSTQMRKLVLEGLYEKGIIDTTDEDKITQPRVRQYLDHVSEYTETVKLELLNEIGFKFIKNEYVPINEDSVTKLADLIRKNLRKEDLLGDDLIEMVDVNDKGDILIDLSIHPESRKIEKLILSLINKRIIKQKVHGEPLVQISSAFLDNGFTTPLNKLTKATDADIKKFAGSNFLPTYHRKKNGMTAAAKVMIALQGDYMNLLNLMYDEENTIAVRDEEGNLLMDESLERLNEKIKDDEWLDADNGAARKAITLVGARIPVQGLNSMEFFEVYHFLSPSAGNIIVPPPEIVAKSGSDFDIDKLTMFMVNINSEGKPIQRTFGSIQEFEEELNLYQELGENTDNLFYLQKAALQNELINDMKEIIELPQNFVSLVTPNGTYLLKEIADDLAQYVMEYDPFANRMTRQNMSAPDKKGKQKKVISPTRIIETLYNIYKHESNVVGKKTLGLGAIENTFHTLINSLEITGGATMPLKYIQVSGKGKLQERDSLLFLKHNKVIKNGQEHISIASRYDANNENKISDIISQMMNGWVDVEKDAWIFFIQGNYEVAPTLLYLIKTGVPVKDAVYFVSQPLVRQYVKEQRDLKSTFGPVLGKTVDSPAFVKYQAATNTLALVDEELGDGKSGNFKRYDMGVTLANNLFEERKTREFTQDEMYQLIKDFKTDKSVQESDLSKAMFLHYLTIEQQIAGITKLKMNTNPDTSTKSNIYAIEETEANLEELESDTKIDQDLLKALTTDSVISSFFNGKLALAISKPLFKLRYHPSITEYLLRNRQKIREYAADTFGNFEVEKYVETFRNDMLSYIFQNAVRRYRLKDTYKSYVLKETTPIKLKKELSKTGAFVDIEGPTPVMYIDKKQLSRDFDSKAWMRDSDAEDAYSTRDLYPLPPGTFLRDAQAGKQEYVRFVLERELLRSLYNFKDVLEKPSVKADLKLPEIAEFSPEKKARYIYEKFISERALENIFNPYMLFENKNTAISVKFANLLAKYPDLLKDYDVLKWFKTDNLKNDRAEVYNLFFSDKNLNRQSANRYRKNLKDLADVTILKSKNPQENLEISEFFQMLPFFAFMQSGINNTKFNFLSLVDFTGFIDIMDQESSVFIKALEKDADQVLNNYITKFNAVNNSYNYTKYRFKDYMTNVKLDVISEDQSSSLRKDLITTSQNNIYQYDDKGYKRGNYDNLVLNNSDIGFVHSIPWSGLADKTKVFGGQASIMYISPASSIAIPTDMKIVGDNFEGLLESAYPKVKEYWEKRILEIKNRLVDNLPVAFSTEGYGNSEKMPQELFVYLSKRLYEEFGYLNPGSTQFKDLQEILKTDTSEITDEEIQIRFDIEEDPFKC